MSVSKLFTASILGLVLLAAPSAASEYTIDPVHSSVVFKVKHLGTSNFYGRFNDIQGELVFDPADPAKSSIAFDIAAESVDTNSDGRDKHLRSPDFFNAKQFPVISFRSTEVEKLADGTYRVTGELEMNGVKKAVTGPVEHTGSGTNPQNNKPIVGFETRLQLKRTDFGIDYLAPAGIGDEVDVIVAIEAIAD